MTARKSSELATDVESAMADDSGMGEDNATGFFAPVGEPEPLPTASKNDDSARETPPKRRKKGLVTRLSSGSEIRHTTEGLFTFAYGGLGTLLVQSGKDVPVGRVLQIQAPIAGPQIDRLIMGSWIDKLLQPIVKIQGTAEGLGALVMLPLLVGAYERNPQLAAVPVFEQIMRASIKSTLTELAPTLKEQQKERQKEAKALADLHDLGEEMFGDITDPEARKVAMADPIGAMLQMIFAGPPDEPVEG